MSAQGSETLDQQTIIGADLLNVESNDQIEDAAFRLVVAKLLGAGVDEVLVDFYTEDVPVVGDRTGQHRTSQLDVFGNIDGPNGRRRSSYCFDETVMTPEFMSEVHRTALGAMATKLEDTQRVVLLAPPNRTFE